MTLARVLAPSSGRPRQKSKLTAIAVALLCAAPVPGDIGACGQPVARLDGARFFLAKKAADCRACSSCGIETDTCVTACGAAPPKLTAFPSDCGPLVHDGEVCLRKLLATSCDEYRSYVADRSPTVPSECDFCPVGQ